MNAELDATVGPILKVYADRAGVVITNTDGDEPGVAMNLYRFAKTIGLKPVLAGNLKGMIDPYRTPDTQREFAEKYHQKPKMITSFADGTKLSMETTVLANATGFRVGKLGLTAIGLTEGVQFDQVNGAGFAGVNLSNYSAIAVASSFGGMLTSAELSALIARSAAIASFVNAGGGLLALAECFPASGFCLANNMSASDVLFGFVPVPVSSVATSAPYALTAAGQALFPTLTDPDVNDPTHNSFGEIGGLTVVDRDQSGRGAPTTLAGFVRINDNGFESEVPAPATALLFGAGLLALAGLRRR